MKQNEPVSKIMTSELKTVHVGQKLSEARHVLAESKFDHVPVVTGQKLVGILSSGDVMRLTFDAGSADERSMDAVLDHQFTIEGTMTKKLVTIKASDPIRHAAKLLVDGPYHCLPVVDDGEKLLGLVTSTDLIRYLLDQY